MELETAKENAIKLANQLHGLKLHSDNRTRVSAACFAVSQQHHNSIIILLSQPHPLCATAFALLRLLIESTTRGLWLMHCATDEQIQSFTESKCKMDAKSIMIALDSVANINNSSLKCIYENSWSSLSAYTHTGDLQIQRWLSTRDIEPNYSKDEVSELLALSDLLARLAAVATKSLSII